MLRTTARIATTRVAIVHLIAQRNATSELPPTSEYIDGCAPRSPRELRRPHRMMRARVVRRAAAAPVVDVCRMRIGIVTTSTTQLGNVACALEWNRTRGCCRTCCSCPVCNNPSVIARRKNAVCDGRFLKASDFESEGCGLESHKRLAHARLRACDANRKRGERAGAVLRTTARIATTRVAIAQLIAQRNANSELPTTSDHNDGCAPRSPRELRRPPRMLRDRVARRAAATQVVAVRRMRIGIVTPSTLEWYRTRGRCRTCCSCAVCNNPSVIARRKSAVCDGRLLKASAFDSEGCGLESHRG